jgi:hypothetical protein
MKNALGTQENLQLYNKEGVVVYKFVKYSTGYWYKSSNDEKGRELTYETSEGYWSKRTRDEKGRELTYEDSKGSWSKSTRDENGNILTYEDSNGTRIGFDIPEYTMEELVEKLGNFKIKK